MANYFNLNYEGGASEFYPSWGVLGDGTTNLFGQASYRQSAVVHSGTYAAKYTITNSQGQQGYDLTVDPLWPAVYPWTYSGSPQLYYRWWMRIDAGFVWGTATRKIKANRTTTSPDGGGFTGYVSGDGFWIGEAVDGDPVAQVNYDLESHDDSQWHEYIMRVKPNSTTVSTDAEFQAYVDGVSIGSVGGFRLTNSSGTFWDAWGSWMQAPLPQLNHVGGGGTIYVDDMSIDDVWNSQIGGGGSAIALDSGGKRGARMIGLVPQGYR